MNIEGWNSVPPSKESIWRGRAKDLMWDIEVFLNNNHGQFKCTDTEGEKWCPRCRMELFLNRLETFRKNDGV